MYFLANIDLLLQVEFFYTMLCPWVTVVNPLVTIWINVPYRDVVKKIIFIILKIDTVTLIHPAPAMAQ
jgi:hypothetical protein